MTDMQDYIELSRMLFPVEVDKTGLERVLKLDKLLGHPWYENFLNDNTLVSRDPFLSPEIRDLIQLLIESPYREPLLKAYKIRKGLT